MNASKITTAQQHQLAVIGAAILDPAACKATVERLTPAMFEDGPYRQLFGAIKLQLDSGHNVDAVILERMLGGDFRPLIVSAAETVPTISHVQDYEALVMEAPVGGTGHQRDTERSGRRQHLPGHERSPESAGSPAPGERGRKRQGFF